MNILHIETAKTETTPGEFVTDGYRIVVKAEGHELDGTTLYQSRFPNKAVIKAFVLLADARFDGWAVTTSGAEVTDAAGKENLRVLIDADRFQAIRELANMQVDVDTTVDAIKTFAGNNVPPPKAADEE